MLKKTFWAMMVIALTALSVQCGSSDNVPITGPSGADGNPAAMEPAGQNYLWGAWQVVADRGTGEVSITQLRQSDLALNVLGFLETAPLTNLSINFDTLIIDIDNNYIGADVILKHPLVTPEGVFHGFDVRGVVFGPEVRNADGWTAMMNPEDFSFEPFGYIDGLLGAPDSFANYTGDWFGYRYFSDGLSLNEDIVGFFTNEDTLLNRGIFEEGNSNSRHYDLYFGGGYTDFLIFNYAVVASYNWPVGDPPFEIDDFEITTGNVAEAFCGSISVINSSLYIGGNGAVGGNISVDVEVWDWQGLADTQIAIVSPVLDTAQTGVYDPGTSSKSGIFHLIDIPGAGTGEEGYHDIWAVVTDHSETFGSSWFMELLSPGNQRYDDPVFSVFRLRVDIPGNTPPVAAAEASTLFPAIDRDVIFDASTSHDNQSPLGDLHFEWDFDYDGTFEYDAGNNPITIHQFTAEGDYTVDLKVTDPQGAWDTLDDPLELTVSYCGEGNAHVDNDGLINISGFSVLPQSMPRYGLAFLTEGPYAGQAVCQAGPYSLGTFNADASGDVSGNILCKLTPYYLFLPSGPTWQPNVPFIIDVSPVGGYILVVTDSRYWTGAMDGTVHTYKLEAYAPDGSGVVFSIRDDVNEVLNAVCALDCDDNGDIWFVGWYFMEAYYLVRIPYTGGSPPWETNINNYDIYDITSYFPGAENVIIDMAIDYADNRIYILATGPDGDGKLSAFDIDEMSPGNPGYDSPNSVTNVFSDLMKVEIDYLGGENPPFTQYWSRTWSYAGIEIDHEEADFERCRIVCYSRIDDGSGGTMPEVVRISSQGEILGSETGTWALRNFGLNNDADEDTRHVTFPGINPMARLWDTPDGW